MRVRINGKEVEVGPGRVHKKDCGCIGKIFQSLTERPHTQKFNLIINGHEVDMNNPDDIQKAIDSCRKIGVILLLVGIIPLFFTLNEFNWNDLNGDIFGGLFVGFIWLLLGSVFAFFTPKSLERRLKELKKQGKFFSKY